MTEKNILVCIGDSYASAGQQVHEDFQYTTDEPTWCDYLATNLNRELVQLGYAYSSWWYSYTRFRQWAYSNPTAWARTDTMVVFLGDNRRLKSLDIQKVNELKDQDKTDILNIIDWRFDYWSMFNFVQELITFGKGRRICLATVWVHDLLILEKAKNHVACLTHPLYELCMAQFEHCAHFHDMIDWETRLGYRFWNHFTRENNLAMADSLTLMFNNYEPGWHTLAENTWCLEKTLTDPKLILENSYRCLEDLTWLKMHILS